MNDVLIVFSLINPSEWTPMVAAIGVLILNMLTGIGALYVSVRTGRKTEALAQKTDVLGVKADTLGEKTEVIKEHVNGAMKAAQEEIKSTKLEVKRLSDILERLAAEGERITPKEVSLALDKPMVTAVVTPLAVAKTNGSKLPPPAADCPP